MTKSPQRVSVSRDGATADDARITEELAEKVMGWRSAPDRFLTSGRSWIPKWRFMPLERVEDAFLLLDRAKGTCVLAIDSEGVITAEFRLGERTGKANGELKARTIALAISRALGIVEVRS
jgi:hypothetical protein